MKKVVFVLSILAIIAFSVFMVGCSNAQKPEKGVSPKTRLPFFLLMHITLLI